MATRSQSLYNITQTPTKTKNKIRTVKVGKVPEQACEQNDFCAPLQIVHKMPYIRHLSTKEISMP